jgi:hypothetical protein
MSKLVTIVIENWIKMGGGEDFPIFQPIRNHGGRLGCMARTVETILEESHVEATVSYNSY